MNPHLGDLLSAYLDGALHHDELGRVADHLEGCSACIAEFRAVQQARSSVRMLPWLEMPEGLEPHAGDLLSAYLDGEVTENEGDFVDRHLTACPSCRDELYELDAARTAVRALPTLEYVHPQGQVRPLRRRRRVVAAAGWAAAVAAATAVTLGIFASGESPRPIDLDAIASRHAARVSVDSGFPAVPVLFPTEAGP